MKMTKIAAILIIAGLVSTGAYIGCAPQSALNQGSHDQDTVGMTHGETGHAADGLREDADSAYGNHENNISEGDDGLKNDIASGYLILVNKDQGLERDYKPDDLTGIKYFASDRGAEGRYMRVAAADAFHKLVEEAEKNDIIIVMTTAYRSYDFQAGLYNGYVERDGQAAADRYSARPGKSEHQTGLAVDVSSPSVGYQLTLKFADTDEGKWIAEHAHFYGFIIRYPKDKENITGYQYEPWHLRYVGRAAADYIYKNELTLEEFLLSAKIETED